MSDGGLGGNAVEVVGAGGGASLRVAVRTLPLAPLPVAAVMEVLARVSRGRRAEMEVCATPSKALAALAVVYGAWVIGRKVFVCWGCVGSEVFPGEVRVGGRFN